MSGKHTSDENHDQVQHYVIRLKGHLDERWVEWFEGLVITLEENGDTLLTGPVVDQAELHGLLKTVRDAQLVNAVRVGRMIAQEPQEGGPTAGHAQTLGQPCPAAPARLIATRHRPASSDRVR